MNKLTIENGSYVLVRSWDNEVFEGESENLIGVFDVDTFTLIDGEYNRCVAIMNALYTDVELNGTVYGSLAELEQAFNEAIEQSGGGGGKDAKDISYNNSKSGLPADNVQDAIDEVASKVGGNIIVFEASDYTGEIMYNGEVISYAQAETLLLENKGKAVLVAKYMNGQYILSPVRTVDSLVFHTVFSENVEAEANPQAAILCYELKNGSNVFTTYMVPIQNLNEKTEVIYEDFREEQVEMYPTVFAVLHFVYGMHYASVIQVEELPAYSAADYNIYLIADGDDFTGYKGFPEAGGTGTFKKIFSTKSDVKSTPVVYILSSTRSVFIDGVQSQTPYTDIKNLLNANRAVEFRFRDDEDASSISMCILEAAWIANDSGIRLQGQYVVDDENVIVRVAILPDQEVFIQTETDEFATKKYVDNSINARVWTGTMKQYNALSTKNPNTVYNVMPNPDSRLRFTAVEPNSSVSYTGTNPATYNWEYSTNGKTWQPYVSDNVINLTNAGDYVMFRGNGCSEGDDVYCFTMTGKIAASGSIMSLIDGVGESVDMNGNSFGYLFWDCASLTTAPELPATTLNAGCYMSMFEYCTSLVTAPELPATTLTKHCYAYMFKECTSLITAPELPAVVLSDYCYMCMFEYCTNLNSVTTYVDNWNTSAADYWLSGVAPTGVVRCKQSANIPLNSESGVPSGWSVEYID